MNSGLGLRIGELIKKLGIKKVRFAERLGVDQSYITQLTKGRREPSDLLITSVCREFSVSEAWLRSGEGEMFIPQKEDALENLAKQHGLTRGDTVVIEKFMELTPDARQAVIEYMQQVVSAISGDEFAAEFPIISGERGPSKMSDAELHAELDRQLTREKEAEDAS